MSVAAYPAFTKTPLAQGIHIALYKPLIPGNTGTIGRTCLALGASLHVINPGFDMSSARVKRAGLDYWPHVKCSTYEDWAEFSQAVDFEEVTPYFFTKFAPASVFATDFRAARREICLVFGSETNGFDDLIKEADDITQKRGVRVSLPLCSDKVRSYNLAMSVQFGLTEAVRQRLQ